jgi:hypothetical protein
MDLSIITVKANSGAICRTCGENIPKGRIALYIHVFGPSRGDHEFHCEKCCPILITKFKNIQLEWKTTNKDVIENKMTQFKNIIKEIELADMRFDKDTAADLHEKRRVLKKDLADLGITVHS